MTPNGLSCWGTMPLTCEKVPSIAPYIPSQSCQPTIVADEDFTQVAPPDFVGANGAWFYFVSAGSLEALPQPKPLRAVAAHYYGGPFGIDFDGQVITWDAPCQKDCASTTIESGLIPVGMASNAYGVCVWDIGGRLSCWGEVAMVGGPTPHVITGLPPARAVIARTSGMCVLGQDGSVTCFGCTKTTPCGDSTQGYWWADSPLTTSPQTFSFPRPVIALVSSVQTCAVLDDLTAWCTGSFTVDDDAGTNDVPTHITALDP